MTGRTLGPYRILEKLGAGGMGEVYKARHERLNRFVALKLLPQAKSGDPEMRRRLVHEAQAASALNHPNIITVYDIITEAESGDEFMVLEFIQGRTLVELIPNDGLRVTQALQFATQMADALRAAHQAGIVHRDIKPGNVMVNAAGRVKVLDFGLAKITGAGLISRTDETRIMVRKSNLTADGLIIGTPNYMSPEQAEGKPVDARTDLFSFGAVLYEMLCGRRAFDGDSTLSILTAVVRQEPEPLRSLVRDLPPEIQAIVSRCMRKDPERRFQKSAHLHAALEALARPAGAAAPQQDVEPPSIAVLPFANLSGEKENEYFSDGLAEEVLHSLAHLPGLRVASRMSSFAFRGKPQNIGEVGRALKVTHLLEGAVRRARGRVRVNVQLASAAEGFQLWSDRFDREMTDLFAIQDEIAQAITGVLSVKLTLPSAPRPTRNVDAYNLFLKGRHLLRKFTLEGNAAARDYLAQALELDPAYAPAQAGIALCEMASGVFGWTAPISVIQKCRQTFRDGLQKDERSGDLHWALGTVLAVFDYDWQGAGREYRRALELEPDSPQAHWTYGYYYLRVVGRLDEALEHLRKAVDLDPVTQHYAAALGDLRTHRGEYDLAIGHLQSAIALEPGSYVGHWLLSSAYMAAGMLPEAVDSAECAARLSRRLPLVLGNLGAAHAAAGRERHARRIIAELEQRAQAAYVPPGALARIYAALGDSDNAFAWLEKAIGARDASAVWLPTDPVFVNLRSDPRHKALLRKMNLE
ncbi:MAG TPA: protein kinase [Bryobacteraceae bacterium]|jgi:serine/threonine-protein kinase|nr:protein kinase [Bryobacteraceae bacterium]